MKRVLLSLILGLTTHLVSAQNQDNRLTTESRTYTSESVIVIDAIVGSLKVPENRANPDSEDISIHFIQLKSTNPDPQVPLVYLEGGPGGSCIWQAGDPYYLEKWLPFLEISDVILLDQRGTGEGTQRVLYIHQEGIPVDILADAAGREKYFEGLSQKALADFEQRGVDLHGYTTLESAQDIDDLRQALSYEQFSLLGFSYGTHLGLTYMKYFSSHAKNAVLVGVEGFNHALKLPSSMDTQLQKIALMAQADLKVSQSVPDLMDLYRRVIRSLDENPAELEIASPLTDEPMQVKVGSFGLNLILLIDMGDASDIPVLPRLLYSIDQGDYSLLRWFVQKRIGNFYGVQGMSITMDLASGTSPSRLERIEEELTKSPFQDIILAVLMNDNWPHPDLGEEFRAPMVSNIPTLFMSGTLDFNTPPYQAEEVRWGFSNSNHIIVNNAGHEQVFTHPEAVPTIIRFLKGENVDEVALSYPPLEFIPVKGDTDGLSHPSIQALDE